LAILLPCNSNLFTKLLWCTLFKSVPQSAAEFWEHMVHSLVSAVFSCNYLSSMFKIKS
jgi:hypothetical protein